MFKITKDGKTASHTTSKSIAGLRFALASRQVDETVDLKLVYPDGTTQDRIPQVVGNRY